MTIEGIVFVWLAVMLIAFAVGFIGAVWGLLD